jgi:hypothetical protein
LEPRKLELFDPVAKEQDQQSHKIKASFGFHSWQ